MNPIDRRASQLTSRSERIPVDKCVTIYRRERSTCWYLEVCRGGERHRISLRTRHRNRALELARVEAARRLSRERNVALAYEMPWDQAVRQFHEEHQLVHHAEKTRKDVAVIFRRFREFLLNRYRGKVPTIEKISGKDIVAFMAEIKKLPGRKAARLSDISVNRHFGELRTLMSWAEREGIIQRSPCHRVKALRVIKCMIKPVRPDELRQLMPFLGPPLRDLIVGYLATGMRSGELRHARADDVLADRVDVRSRPGNLIKDREERTIPVENKAALKMFARRKHQAGNGGLLFPNQRGKPLDARDLLRKLHAVCRKAGIRCLNFQLLRHTYATREAGRLMPFELMRRLGHSSVMTTMRYVHMIGRHGAAMGDVA